MLHLPAQLTIKINAYRNNNSFVSETTSISLTESRKVSAEVQPKVTCFAVPDKKWSQKQPVSANDQHCTNEIDFCETAADLIRQWTRILIVYRIIEWLLQHPKSQNDDEEACSADRQDHLLGEDCSVDMTDNITCLEEKLAQLTDKITCLD